MMEKEKRTIRNQIPAGRENAVQLEELCRLWNVPPRRARQKIAELRAAGELIMSDTKNGGGYYFAASREELASFVKSMSSRARKTYRATAAARAELRRLEREAEDA